MTANKNKKNPARVPCGASMGNPCYQLFLEIFEQRIERKAKNPDYSKGFPNLKVLILDIKKRYGKKLRELFALWPKDKHNNFSDPTFTQCTEELFEHLKSEVFKNEKKKRQKAKVDRVQNLYSWLRTVAYRYYLHQVNKIRGVKGMVVLPKNQKSTLLDDIRRMLNRPHLTEYDLARTIMPTLSKEDLELKRKLKTFSGFRNAWFQQKYDKKEKRVRLYLMRTSNDLEDLQKQVMEDLREMHGKRGGVTIT